MSESVNEFPLYRTKRRKGEPHIKKQRKQTPHQYRKRLIQFLDMKWRLNQP